jgi:hypothetical protein
MRRAFIFASVFAAATSFAQVHGTPASVSSPRADNNKQFMVPNGVPASVTSLGPQGFAPRINPLFPGNPAPPPRHDHHHHIVPVPIYYTYPVYSDYSYAQPEPQVQEPLVEKEAPPQRVEIVIVDKREEEKKQAALEADLKAAAAPKKSDLSAAPQDPAIFVFKDGSRKELANFAVMAGNLYDLSDGKMFKIALNTIDRDATLAANAQAGRAIQLP